MIPKLLATHSFGFKSGDLIEFRNEFRNEWFLCLESKTFWMKRSPTGQWMEGHDKITVFDLETSTIGFRCVFHTNTNIHRDGDCKVLEEVLQKIQDFE